MKSPVQVEIMLSTGSSDFKLDSDSNLNDHVMPRVAAGRRRRWQAGISRKNRVAEYTDQGAWSKIKKQEQQIKRLTDQLTPEAAHLLLADQRSDLSATSISALTADNNRQREEKARLEQRVALLTAQ